MKTFAPFDLATRDITEDPSLYEHYKNVIPVVSIDGNVKLAGSALSNPRTLKEMLRRAIFDT
jgi:hypothetical protein